MQLHMNGTVPMLAIQIPQERSTARDRLCSRPNAERVALRLFEATQHNVAVVRTANPLQPFRVILSADVADEAVEVEMVR